MAQLNFDASQVQPAEAPEAVPAGWYVAAIVESEMKPTKDNHVTGNAYLELKEKILEGEHAGKYIFDRLNLQHQNPVTVEIAYRQLSSYCHSTGVIQVADSSQLHNIPFRVRVSFKPAEGEYNASNDVKAVKHISEAVPGAQAAAPVQQTQHPPAGQGWTPPAASTPPASASTGWTPPAQQQQPPAGAGGWQPPAQQPHGQQQAGQTPPWAGQGAAAASNQQTPPAGGPPAGGGSPPPWARQGQ